MKYLVGYTPHRLDAFPLGANKYAWNIFFALADRAVNSIHGAVLYGPAIGNQQAALRKRFTSESSSLERPMS